MCKGFKKILAVILSLVMLNIPGLPIVVYAEDPSITATSTTTGESTTSTYSTATATTVQIAALTATTEATTSFATTTEPATSFATSTEPATTSATTAEPATSFATTTEPATTSATTTEPATTTTTTTEPATTTTTTAGPATTTTTTAEPATTTTTTAGPATTTTTTAGPATTTTTTAGPATASTTTTTEPTTTSTTTTMPIETPSEASAPGADAAALYNGHIYAAYDVDVSWLDAEAYCESVGGHLVTITSQGEQSFVESLLNERPFRGYWLGGYCQDGNWDWVTGENFTYTNWDYGQPSDSQNDMYIQMFVTDPYCTKFKWDDTWNEGDIGGGNRQQGFVCEWDSDTLTTMYGTINEAYQSVPYAAIVQLHSPDGQLIDTAGASYKLLSDGGLLENGIVTTENGVDVLSPAGIFNCVPQQYGHYMLKTNVAGSFDSSPATIYLILKINETVPEGDIPNLVSSDDPNLKITTPIGDGANSVYTLTYGADEPARDEILVIEASDGTDENLFTDFRDLYIDGQKMVRSYDPADKDGKDYYAEKGSLKLTLFQKTVEGLTNNGKHTITADFEGTALTKTQGSANRTVSQVLTVTRESVTPTVTPVPVIVPRSGGAATRPAATPTATRIPTPTPTRIPTPSATPTPTAAPFDRFTDLEGHWAYNYIKRVFGEGLMTGESETVFNPNGAVTYASLLSTLLRLSGNPAADPAAYPAIPAGQWYSNAFAWALENNIISTDDVDRFVAGDNLSRVDIMRVFYRYGNYRGADMTTRADLSAFTDISDIPPNDMDVVSWCVGKKFIVGRGNGKLDPSAGTTRAEMAVLLTKIEDLFLGN